MNPQTGSPRAWRFTGAIRRTRAGAGCRAAAAITWVVPPHLAALPGLCIMATVLAFNLFGDALRDALDPRLGR